MIWRLLLEKDRHYAEVAAFRYQEMLAQGALPHRKKSTLNFLKRKIADLDRRLASVPMWEGKE